MYHEESDAEAALAAYYADQEGALADLLERLEAETPTLDELLLDLDNQRALEDVLARLQSDCCPFCGRPMAEASPADHQNYPKRSPAGRKNHEKPRKSAKETGQKQGKCGADRRTLGRPDGHYRGG